MSSSDAWLIDGAYTGKYSKAWASLSGTSRPYMIRSTPNYGGRYHFTGADAQPNCNHMTGLVHSL
jgi:hypothetical protein